MEPVVCLASSNDLCQNATEYNGNPILCEDNGLGSAHISMKANSISLPSVHYILQQYVLESRTLSIRVRYVVNSQNFGLMICNTCEII